MAHWAGRIGWRPGVARARPEGRAGVARGRFTVVAVRRHARQAGGRDPAQGRGHAEPGPHAARRDDTSADTRETKRPVRPPTESPRAARSDDNKPLRDKAPAKQDAGDGKAAEAEATPGTAAKPAKAAAAAGRRGQGGGCGGDDAHPTPVMIQIQPNPAAPSRPPRPRPPRRPRGGRRRGERRRVRARRRRCLRDRRDRRPPTDGKGADAKDFLALLGEPRADAPRDTRRRPPPRPRASRRPRPALRRRRRSPPGARADAGPRPLGQVPMTIGLRSRSPAPASSRSASIPSSSGGST